MPLHTHADDTLAVITLFDSVRTPYTFDLLDATLAYAADQLDACIITVRIDYERYLRIERYELLNLDADVRGPILGGSFQVDTDVVIEARLDAQFLESLAQIAPTSDALVALFHDLAQSEPDHALLFTESWFALYVTQAIPPPAHLSGGAIRFGYSTLWAEQDSNTRGKLPEHPGLHTVLAYLLEHKHPHTYLPDAAYPIVKVSLDGTSGNWKVFVHLPAEPNEQCIMLSLMPFHAPEDRINAMLRHLMAINYTLTIGNFELDPDDGEIRFRTSLDIDHQMFTSAIFGQLWAKNVAAVDEQFWPLAQLLDVAPGR